MSKKKSIEDFKYVTPEEYAAIGHTSAANRELLRKRAAENPDKVKRWRDEWRKRNPDKVKRGLQKYYEAHATELLAYQRIYKASHKQQNAAYDKVYRQRNPEKRTQTTKRYRDANKPKINSYRKGYQSTKMKTDPGFKLRVRLSIRLWEVLKSQYVVKSETTMKLVGCTKEDLMIHLQNQFRKGMSWNNYGPVWHIDHIKPCCKFDLTDSKQQKMCFHWSNLQPLFGPENLAKGAKYVEVEK